LNYRKGFLYFLLIAGFAADFGGSGYDSAGTVAVKTATWRITGDIKGVITLYNKLFPN
jgi:hypothetical protein